MQLRTRSSRARIARRLPLLSLAPLLALAACNATGSDGPPIGDAERAPAADSTTLAHAPAIPPSVISGSSVPTRDAQGRPIVQTPSSSDVTGEPARADVAGATPPSSERAVAGSSEQPAPAVSAQQAQADAQTDSIAATDDPRAAAPEPDPIGDTGTFVRPRVPVEVAPKLIADRSPQPEYPLMARQRRQEGAVLLRITVSETGAVAKVEVARSSGHAALDGAAVDAVEQWVYEPGTVDDVAVARTIEHSVRFRLSD
jgi:protein TonB